SHNLEVILKVQLIRTLLGGDLAGYELIATVIHRLPGITEGSVGLVLTSINAGECITVSSNFRFSPHAGLRIKGFSYYYRIGGTNRWKNYCWRSHIHYPIKA